MKKQTKRILIIVGVVCIVHLLPVIYFLFFHHVTPDQLRKDIIEYEDVYTAVAELYYQDYQNYNTDVIHYDKPSGTEISCREQEGCEQHKITQHWYFIYSDWGMIG